MKRILVVALLAATGAHAAPASKNERAAIVAWATAFFADPYSLRSTQISDHASVNGVEVLCIAANAKSLEGGYAGIDYHPFEVTAAGLVPAQRSYRVGTDTCHQPQIRATMRPFPELAAIR